MVFIYCRIIKNKFKLYVIEERPCVFVTIIAYGMVLKAHRSETLMDTCAISPGSVNGTQKSIVFISPGRVVEFHPDMYHHLLYQF